MITGTEVFAGSPACSREGASLLLNASVPAGGAAPSVAVTRVQNDARPSTRAMITPEGGGVAGVRFIGFQSLRPLPVCEERPRIPFGSPSMSSEVRLSVLRVPEPTVRLTRTPVKRAGRRSHTLALFTLK